MSEPLSDDEVEAYLPADASVRTRWFLRRFAGSVLAHYREMDPLVAQFWATPGLTPIDAPETDDGRPAA